MHNPFEDGSLEHELLAAADALADSPASGDTTADAIDRLSVAIYRVGAVLASGVGQTGNGLYEIAEKIYTKDFLNPN